MLKCFSHRRDEAPQDEAPRDEAPTGTVVVSAAALIGWDEYLTRSMQRGYRIIQLLKEHRRRSTRARRAESRASTSAAPHSKPPQVKAPQAQDSPSPDPATHGGMTLDEAHEAIVRERCEALRPQAKWVEIAATLGISDKTLWEHRREMYDPSHKFHPD